MSSHPIVETTIHPILHEIMALEETISQLTSVTYDSTFSQFESNLIVSFLRTATITLRQVVSLIHARRFPSSAPATPAHGPQNH